MKDKLINLIDKGLSKHNIASELNVSVMTIQRWLEDYNLETRAMREYHNCKFCGKILEGKQRYFCSDICKNKFYYNNKNTVRERKCHMQTERSTRRKMKLVELLGGKCQLCGYDKNLSCLCFHHLNEREKKFGIAGRKLGTAKWEEILEEANKCILLCHNCHIDLHHPHTRIDNINDQIIEWDKDIERAKLENAIKRAEIAKHIAEEKERSKNNKSNKQIKAEEAHQRRLETERKRAELIKQRIKLIEESGIDFSKIGWNKKIRDLLHLSDQGARKFIKVNMPDVYNTAWRSSRRID